MGTERSPERTGSRDPATQPRRNLTAKQIASGAGLVVLVVFALLNLQEATMHWIVVTTHTPLIVLVAICGLIGAGVGYALGRRGRAAPDRHE